MSHQAVEWALVQRISHAPAKQILTVMAHYAHKDQRPWTAYPSVTQLVRDTGQDRKTVLANLVRLVECGALRDTGERAGMTKSVTVYELSEPTSDTKTGTASRGKSSTKSGTASNAEAVPKLALLSSTETGTALGGGSSPNFSGSSTSFSGKQSQNPPEAVPVFPTEQVEQVLGTGKGTGKRAPAHATPKRLRLTEFNLPDWLPRDAWVDWVEHRIAVKAPMTERAATMAINHLAKLRAAGNDPVAVIEQSVRSGKWTDLYPLRDQRGGSGMPMSRQAAAEAEHQRFLQLTSGGGM
ncbi:hypothetical protein RA224_12945 [Achromobacter aegrifaciens]|uniref:hypothetical protein n=1 Tax=Achromobacter aegrifaciens TaxID=1287736 RepID=UPI0027B8C54A|nr:hypothetical protein [Achromobacter aegrifaciens]WLW64292.1 hypothetical protein RA224_12945 [Achromobacter aegrifaciens]